MGRGSVTPILHSSPMLARLCRGSWRADVAKRDERIAKLEALIAEAEFMASDINDGLCCYPGDACPWCASPVRTDGRDRVPRIEHTADCPAFSAPGEVRR